MASLICMPEMPGKYPSNRKKATLSDIAVALSFLDCFQSLISLSACDTSTVIFPYESYKYSLLLLRYRVNVNLGLTNLKT